MSVRMRVVAVLLLVVFGSAMLAGVTRAEKPVGRAVARLVVAEPQRVTGGGSTRAATSHARFDVAQARVQSQAARFRAEAMSAIKADEAANNPDTHCPEQPNWWGEVKQLAIQRQAAPK
jgi:hypothetical protein